MITGSLGMPRKKKRSTVRRRFTGINVLNVAEGYVQANIWTEAMFNTNPVEFLTGFTSNTGWDFRPGSDGGEVITLPELLGAGPGGPGGHFGAYAADLPHAISKNLTGQQNASAIQTLGSLWEPAVKSALIGVGFKVGKKMTRSPRAKLNRALRQVGVGDFIKL